MKRGGIALGLLALVMAACPAEPPVQTDAGTVDAVDGSDASPAAITLPTLTLNASGFVDFCADACAAIGTRCGTLWGFDDGSGDCPATCIARLKAEPWWAASYTCQGLACDAAYCAPGGWALGPDSAIESVCAAIDGCEASAPSGRTHPEMDWCRAINAGRLAADAGHAEWVACAFSALVPVCDLTAVGACAAAETAIEYSVLCQQQCTGVFTPDYETYCAEGTPLRDAWASPVDCIEHCPPGETDLPNHIAFLGCVFGGACGDPSPCEGADFTPPAGCVHVCESLFDGCATGVGFLPSIETCAGWCRGLELSLKTPAASPAEVDLCLAAVTDCGSENSRYTALTTCAFQGVIPNLCGLLCKTHYSGAERCAPESALRKAWPSVGDCEAGCEAQAGPLARLSAHGCRTGIACGDPSVCVDAPEIPLADVTAACSALTELCGAPALDLPESEQCGAYLTGLLYGYGVAAKPGAAACIAANVACPADPLSLLGPCLLPE